MTRNVWGALLAGAAVALSACGPADDGGGGVVGDTCNVAADCVPNACCGNGNGVVGKSRAPDCSAPCPAGSPDPTNQTVNNTCGIPACSSFHCTIASRC